VIAWLDQCGYVIVSKEALQDEATSINHDAAMIG
jgi:hypothetical protein